MSTNTSQTIHIGGARILTRVLYVALCLWSLVPIVRAQQVDLATKLRLAQGFEQAGEWERAAAIYESLLDANPQSFVILDGLRRSYTELKEYDKAMYLVREQLRTNPADENLLATLGGLYDLADQPQMADSIWHVVIRKDVKNANLYRVVAAQLIDHRQYEKAIQIYLEGREGTKNQNLYIEELASLYGALHQYEYATREYVKSIRLNPQQVSYVQSRLSSFSGREEARRAALDVIREEVARKPEEVPMHSILAWLLMEGKQFDMALDQHRIMDRLTNANGAELFQFGQRAAQEHAYLTSARAFREVIDKKAGPTVVPYARFGYARAIEELSAENDSVAQAPGIQPSDVGGGTVSETQPTFQGALALYGLIIADYPASDIAMQALFRIGTIRFTRFFDLNGAASAFDKARGMQSNANLMYDATMSLAEIQTARNDLGRAREEYSRLLANAPDQYRDQVLFHLAELDYFEAKFDSASAILQHISSNVSNDLTNDALQLLYFIQEHRAAGPRALTDFAHADLLVRQRKYSEALVRYQSIIAEYPSTPLVDDGMMRIGELQLHLNHVDEALTVFGKVVHDVPTSILRDHAQMRIAEVYETRLKDKQKALEAYEQLLTEFPTSLFVEEARKRIRILRGDSI
jgi:tetratricopeptide (TPR) repeat protein